jgi:hypothetical protein
MCVEGGILSNGDVAEDWKVCTNQSLAPGAPVSKLWKVHIALT